MGYRFWDSGARHWGLGLRWEGDEGGGGGGGGMRIRDCVDARGQMRAREIIAFFFDSCVLARLSE